MIESSPPKVFISYSHDSDEHRQRVLELSNRLRADGIDCWIDQYEPAPPEGWPRKMDSGIRESNFVLMVCTETYRKRLDLEEENGKGLGVRWEGSLIYNILYRNETFNYKFIPVLFESKNKSHIPDILFGYDHYDLSQPRNYDHLYRHIRGELGATKPAIGKPHLTRTIYSNSLPTVEGEFFGRKDELALLDQAWANPQTHVVQFIASGGTGKTKLLKHWLDTNADSIEALIAWSFYSQGSSEEKQISATPFFNHAFSILKSDKTTFTTEEEKGEHLAHLLRQKRCVLMLDGLEPLQYAGRGMRGELKDRAIRQLLRSLSGEYNSFCIITSRIAVHEIADRQTHVVSHDLQNLAVDDGVKLLESLGVHGGEAYQPEIDQLVDAVKEYQCHALALYLLGNAIHTYYDGDILKRVKLDELIDDYDGIERHAFKVMQAYKKWLKDTPELQLLYLLSLFDHPIETEVLEILWHQQIPEITANIDQKAWKIAIRDLREKHHLLSIHEGRLDLLDCHPLIREYFGIQLQSQHPERWQQAHTLLYEYYKTLPEKLYGKFLPDSLEEMQPLFSAVEHGCAAGLYQQVKDEVYWPRIQRKNEYFIYRKLGAFSEDLASVTHFFVIPWLKLATGLAEQEHPAMFARSGFDLRALGRLREAQVPFDSSLELLVDQKDFKQAAAMANNLSELHLSLGEVAQAVSYGRRSMELADKSGDLRSKRIFRTTFADALHQTGETIDAVALFQEAEKLQQELEPEYPRLFSVEGFQYCDLLLEQAGYDSSQIMEVIKRTEQALKWAKDNYFNLLGVALDQLTLGRAYMQKALCQITNPEMEKSARSRELEQQTISASEVRTRLSQVSNASYRTTNIIAYPSYFDDENMEQARSWLEEAVSGLRSSGQQWFLPFGMLTRAAMHRVTGNLIESRKDLQEVFDIAKPNGMRLHLTDYHLEMARLLLAEGKPVDAREYAGKAVKLIGETGYHRRDVELRELQEALQ